MAEKKEAKTEAKQETKEKTIKAKVNLVGYSMDAYINVKMNGKPITLMDGEIIEVTENELHRLNIATSTAVKFEKVK